MGCNVRRGAPAAIDLRQAAVTRARNAFANGPEVLEAREAACDGPATVRDARIRRLLRRGRPPENAGMLRSLFWIVLVVGLLLWSAPWVLRQVRGGVDEASAMDDAQRQAAPRGAPSAQPIELTLRRGFDTWLLAWGALIALAGVALFDDPGPLRTPWLAVPVGLVALAIGATMVAGGWRRPDGQLVASPEGLRFEADGRSASLAWPRVARVVLLRTGNLKSGGANTTTLVVLDVDGQRFLGEELPIGPPEAWERLLASVQPWSGRPIERRNNKL